MNSAIDPNRTALLFFDMLNGHIKQDDPVTQERVAPVVHNATRLLQTARNKNVMVAYAYANHRDDNGTTAQTIRDTDNWMRPLSSDHKETRIFGAGSWEARVIDELEPQPEEYMIPKFRWNAFHQTYLDLALRVKKIDTIIISGGSTDVGVASTAYCARDLDYNLVFASDASTSHQMESHHYFMRNVFPRMGRVRTVDEIEDMLK